MSVSNKNSKTKSKIGLSNPFNYTGSKHRYLSDLLEILPADNNLIVADPFCGGGDLCSNLPISWIVYASDSMPQIIGMHRAVASGAISADNAMRLAYKYQLNNLDEKHYYSFRDHYNKNKGSLGLYVLLCHSNTNRIRFNSNGEFNMPFGDRWFNLEMQKKLDDYRMRLHMRNVEFHVKSYIDIDFSFFDIALIDPPYLNTTATYNKSGAWSLADELHLHGKIKSECKKFVYFGQIWSKGVHNEALELFSLDYNVKVLKDTTGTCSNNRKKGKTVEVMIWNF